MTKLVGVLLLMVGVAGADEPSFEALGQVPVVGGDRVRARERALDEAARQAVAQAAATILDPDQLVARNSDLTLRIYPRARTYLVNYRVLTETEENGLFELRISAQVATAKLSRDLSAPVVNRPPTALRALACARMAGKPAEAPSPDKQSLIPQPAQTSTQAVLEAAQKALGEILKSRNVELIGGDCSVAAIRAAQAQGALVAVVEVAPSGLIRGSDKLSAHAKVHLGLVDPDGKEGAGTDLERDAYDADAGRASARAASEAVLDAAVALQPSLAARWSPVSTTRGIVVRLSNLLVWADYQTLVRGLATLPGISGVEPRRIAQGEAELLVRTQIAAAQLKSGLERLGAGSGPKLSVQQDSDGALEVRLLGTGAPPAGIPVPVEPPPG